MTDDTAGTTSRFDDGLAVVVKSPTDAPGTPALSLRLPRDAKVVDMKIALATQHPRRPPAASQRLIHAGKLLADGANLADVLTGAPPHVVHLVATPAPKAPPSRTVQQMPLPAMALMQQQHQRQQAQQHVFHAFAAEVERAFAKVLTAQNRYQALIHANPPPTPEAVAAEFSAVREAMAQYDRSVQRQRDVLSANNASQMQYGMSAVWRARDAPPAPAAPRNAPAFQPDPAPAQGNGQQVIRRHLVFQFDLHWGLLLKLIFFVFVLAQDGTERRTKMLSALAVLVYLWQTGNLGFLRRLFGVLLPSPNQLFSSLGAARDESVPIMWRIAVGFSYLYSFFYGFVCSLLPSWNPEPLPPLFHLVVNAADNNTDTNAPVEPVAPHQHAD